MCGTRSSVSGATPSAASRASSPSFVRAVDAAAEHRHGRAARDVRERHRLLLRRVDLTLRVRQRLRQRRGRSVSTSGCLRCHGATFTQEARSQPRCLQSTERKGCQGPFRGYRANRMHKRDESAEHDQDRPKQPPPCRRGACAGSHHCARDVASPESLAQPSERTCSISRGRGRPSQ
jgi:hypothetical protein